MKKQNVVHRNVSARKRRVAAFIKGIADKVGLEEVSDRYVLEALFDNVALGITSIEQATRSIEDCFPYDIAKEINRYVVTRRAHIEPVMKSNKNRFVG